MEGQENEFAKHQALSVLIAHGGFDQEHIFNLNQVLEGVNLKQYSKIRKAG